MKGESGLESTGVGREQRGTRVDGKESSKCSWLEHRTPTFFTIISDTDCLILILLVKKYLSRYKNKPTKLQAVRVKIYPVCVGEGQDQHRHESFSVI